MKSNNTAPTFENLPENVQQLREEISELKALITEIKIPLIEEYLTTDQLCNILGISKVCLWNWDKKGITRPIRIGNLKRYRRSDLEKILQEIHK